MVRVDRIRENTQRVISGEMEVHKTDVHPSMAYHARLPLLGPKARAEAARECDDRFAMNGVWRGVIDQACEDVVAKWRVGEPLVDLGGMAAREAVRYRVHPFLLERQPSLLYGDGGVGKSLKALYWGQLVQEGLSLPPLQVERGQVLYLDYEQSDDEMQARNEAGAWGLGLDKPPNIAYRFCYQPLYDDVDAIQRIVADRDVKFIIIDSAGPACGGEPESATNTIQYFRALRALRVATLTIAHVSKGGGGSKGPFGSVYWMNLSRTVWEMKKSQQMGLDGLDVALWHRKANSGKLLRPHAYRIEFNDEDETTKFLPIDIKASPELAEGLPLAERIQTLLSRGARKSEDIAENLEVSVSVARVTLSRNKNRFLSLKGGLWGNRSESSQ